MKIVCVDNEIDESYFDELKEFELEWLAYSHMKDLDNESHGLIVTWNGKLVLVYYCRFWVERPLRDYSVGSSVYTPEEYLEQILEGCNPVFHKSRKMLLHSLSGLEAPDCVVADWYEERGEYVKASMLREAV